MTGTLIWISKNPSSWETLSMKIGPKVMDIKDIKQQAHIDIVISSSQYPLYWYAS